MAKVHEVHPELYRSGDKALLYRFVDGLLRYAKQNTDAAWYRALPAASPTPTPLEVTVQWILPPGAPAPPSSARPPTATLRSAGPPAPTRTPTSAVPSASTGTTTDTDDAVTMDAAATSLPASTATTTDTDAAVNIAAAATSLSASAATGSAAATVFTPAAASNASANSTRTATNSGAAMTMVLPKRKLDRMVNALNQIQGAVRSEVLGAMVKQNVNPYPGSMAVDNNRNDQEQANKRRRL
ncbi:hypothetical protein FN846DRAFT_891377 [Sphaerosporella brunnea]|uniref:Uncharacterized protein n=1 Tax=Sphaerosporella brunnea TaxID=1250544 RepID=A0A5J5ESS1_9PEZI|nr:hypothetical protein FN846DRAFT_891377 [Sphaerosporella brunnea]